MTQLLHTRSPGFGSCGSSAAWQLVWRIVSSATALGLATALVACGGGSGLETVSSPTAGSTGYYTVGRTVTNLQVTGLSVMLSVAGTTASYAVPPSQTNFSFTTTLPTSTTYNVVITQQPLSFTQACGIANGSGTIAQANVNNVAISCHTATAVVSTLAGTATIPLSGAYSTAVTNLTSTQGFINGPGATATFDNPHGVAVDSAGNVFVSDLYNYVIRKITPSGFVSTLAGTGVNVTVSGGTSTTALGKINQIATDAAGNVYAADPYNSLIRKITPDGSISIFAGGGINHKTAGYQDGTATVALFNNPYGVAVDTAGNVYVSDSYNCLIRKITPDLQVHTLAGGSGGTSCGYSNNQSGTSALFAYPYGIAVDPSGAYVYVADYANNVIRRVSTVDSSVTTLAGGGSIGGIAAGYADGNGYAALFGQQPRSLAVNSAGYVYVADYTNNLIRKISPTSDVTTLAGGGGVGLTNAGAANGVGSAATFNNPWGVAVDSAGNLYIGDDQNSLVRKITPQ